MFDYETKTDNVSVLSAASFNNLALELENAVLKSGISLDTIGTPTSQEMLAQAITRAAQGSQSYQDSGTANSYVLTAIGGFKQPTVYTDGMVILFQAGTSNTGASTVNVASIGAIGLVDKDGTALSSGAVSENEYISAKYDSGSNKFEITNTGSSFASDAESNAGLLSNVALVPSNFAQQSKTANGYQKLPSGIIIQWGQVTTYNSDTTVTFPIAFPTGVLQAGNIGKTVFDVADANGLFTDNYTTTTMRIGSGTTTSTTSRWIAIGH